MFEVINGTVVVLVLAVEVIVPTVSAPCTVIKAVSDMSASVRPSDLPAIRGEKLVNWSTCIGPTGRVEGEVEVTNVVDSVQVATRWLVSSLVVLANTSCAFRDNSSYVFARACCVVMISGAENVSVGRIYIPV